MDIELRKILDEVYANRMKPDEAQWKICVLFNVSKQSEQLFCDACGKPKEDGLDHCTCYEGEKWLTKANNWA